MHGTRSRIQLSGCSTSLAEERSRNPAQVKMAYTPDSIWRNRDQFFQGRDAIERFLKDKWSKENGYRLRKELFSFNDNKVFSRERPPQYHPSPRPQMSSLIQGETICLLTNSGIRLRYSFGMSGMMSRGNGGDRTGSRTGHLPRMD